MGVSGASGAPIAVRLLEELRRQGVDVALVVSSGGAAVLKEESGIEPTELSKLARSTYADSDIAAPIASGSRPSRGMVIVPCSGNTVAKVALGLADSLLTRAAQVHLKERRTLIVVPRESPYSPILLGHLTRLSELGVLVLPPAPPYYLHPASVEEMTAYFAGKVLDHLGLAHDLYRGWRASRT